MNAGMKHAKQERAGLVQSVFVDVASPSYPDGT